jgi:peptidoglycan LD-endopeptidase CwlK
MDHNTQYVVDSNMGNEEALAQNPANSAPQEIIDEQEVVNVQYFGFDGYLHSGQIVINKRLVGDIKKFFDLAVELKFPIKSVIPISSPQYGWDDEVSCGANNSSGFNYRAISGDTTRLSKHANGSAFDINPVENIYIKYDTDEKELFRFPADGVYDESAPGTLTATHPLVLLMKDLGWEWGGDWTPATGRADYQHFEITIV